MSDLRAKIEQVIEDGLDRASDRDVEGNLKVKPAEVNALLKVAVEYLSLSKAGGEARGSKLGGDGDE